MRFFFQAPPHKSFLLLPILWMVVLQCLSGVPNPSYFEEKGEKDTFLSNLAHQLHDYDPDFQNFMHIPLFGTLGWLWAWILLRYNFPRQKYLTLVFTISLGYGLLNELSQHFVPRRFPGIEDLSFNWLGSTLFIFLFLFIRKGVTKETN
jgi:VanZ family protein